MKRTLLALTFGMTLLAGQTVSAQSQIIWTDSLIQNVAANSSQNAAWTAFCASLTPRTYTKVIIKGTYDPVGQSCTDSVIATALANSLYTNTDYISPSSCNGNVWHNCASHGFYGEVWLNPPNACDPNNCPFGYIIRPNISVSNPGNYNWGGVNTNTCSAPTQRMTMIFEYGTVTSAPVEHVQPLIGLEVYPNPFGSSFSLDVTNITSADLEIFDMLGQSVMTEKITAGITAVDAGSFAPGIYFVKVRTEESTVLKKVIKAAF